MKMKFKDLYIGQLFTHFELGGIMVKIENERYRLYTEQKHTLDYYETNKAVFKDKIEPNTPLAETFVEVE